MRPNENDSWVVTAHVDIEECCTKAVSESRRAETGLKSTTAQRDSGL